MTTESMLYPHRHLPGGCQCSYHVAEARRDAEQRDRALAAVVYELGAEQMRLAALARTPEFHDAFAKAG